MVNAALGIVPLWTELASSPCHCAVKIALLGAAPCQCRRSWSRLINMTCGRGGTGRRAALRSLWPKGRGSSSLLDRTSTRSRVLSDSGRCGSRCRRGHLRLGSRLDRPHTHDRFVGRDLEVDTEVALDFGRGGGLAVDPDGVRSVSDAVEQEESVEIGAGFGDCLSAGID